MTLGTVGMKDLHISGKFYKNNEQQRRCVKLPNYFNPYNFYPVGYANQMGYSGVPVQQPSMSMTTPMTQTVNNCAMAWVDGEIEARGRQMPQGVTQLAMWDTNQPVIYLKSLNQMGMPNPMQVLRYTVEEAKQALTSGQADTGNEKVAMPDMSQYITRDELNELLSTIRSKNNQVSGNKQNTSVNQNGSTNAMNNGNRGNS